MGRLHFAGPWRGFHGVRTCVVRGLDCRMEQSVGSHRLRMIWMQKGCPLVPVPPFTMVQGTNQPRLKTYIHAMFSEAPFLSPRKKIPL